MTNAAPQTPAAPPAAASADDREADIVDFGYADVPRAEKRARVRAVFDSVATRYDLMNDLMSGGVHRLWKDALVDRLSPRPGWRLLDVAGGTGDIARRFLRRAGATGRAVVCDLTPAMLEVGRARGAGGAFEDADMGRIDWTAGRAEALPFADAQFDACTIAFGVRNVADRAAGLAEMRRVLKPGGRFACLEFSTVTVPLFDRLYDAWSFGAAPRLGAAVARDRASYAYLVESIRRFPGADAFAAEIAAAGFSRVSYRRLTCGVAAIHTGWRL